MLLSASSVQAGSLKASGGVTVTSQDLPLAGVSLAGGYKTEGPNLWVTNVDNQEFTLFYHSLSGTGNTSLQGITGTSTVTFNAWEMGYFLTWNLGNYAVGPGLSYGVAETTDSNGVTNDSSAFMTATDVHYGAAHLRIEKTIFSINCDADLSSFGGLIGGSLLCGIDF